VPHEDVRVVGLDLDLAALAPGQPEVAIAPAATEPEGLPELVHALQEVLGQAARAIVVVPGWLDAGAVRRVHTALALLDTDRVALHHSRLPPLGASVTAALAAAVASSVAGAGPLAGALPAIEGELIAGAWLASVTGLKQPAPSLGQHARSALPGAAFAARVQPDPAVITLGRDGPAPFERPPRSVELVIAAGEGTDAGWVDDVVVPALGDPPVSEVAPSPGAAAWWGTTKVVEFVAHPAGLEQLAHRTVPADLVACRWCAEPVAAGPPCPFCGERNRAAQAGSHSALGPSARRS